jgi:hypothetical protein
MEFQGLQGLQIKAFSQEMQLLAMEFPQPGPLHKKSFAI